MTCLQSELGYARAGFQIQKVYILYVHSFPLLFLITAGIHFADFLTTQSSAKISLTQRLIPPLLTSLS